MGPPVKLEDDKSQELQNYRNYRNHRNGEKEKIVAPSASAFPLFSYSIVLWFPSPYSFSLFVSFRGYPSSSLKFKAIRGYLLALVAGFAA